MCERLTANNDLNRILANFIICGQAWLGLRNGKRAAILLPGLHSVLVNILLLRDFMKVKTWKIDAQFFQSRIANGILIPTPCVWHIAVRIFANADFPAIRAAVNYTWDDVTDLTDQKCGSMISRSLTEITIRMMQILSADQIRNLARTLCVQRPSPRARLAHN